MKIKEILQKTGNGARKALKVAVGTAGIAIPLAMAQAKPLNIQQTQESVRATYLNGSEFKVGPNGWDLHGGLIANLGSGQHLDLGVRVNNGNPSWEAALLGKSYGIEANGNFSDNVNTTLEGMLYGIGVGLTGNLTTDSIGTNYDLSAKVFRAEQLGDFFVYGEAGGNKNLQSITGLGFYTGFAVGETGVIPLVYATKLFPEGQYVMGGLIFASGNVSVTASLGTSDFETFDPGLKVKYKFK